MKTLRTPDERFRDLPGFSFAPRYTEVPDGDGGALRIHHLDQGPRDGEIVLCMHGQPTWSYLYRHMIPLLTRAGLRVLAPDLVGFGRSDKPAAREDYTFERQVGWLNAWLRENDVRGATLVGQDWGGLIGLRMVAENPDRFARVVVANTGLPAPREMAPEQAEALRELRRTLPTPTMQELAQALANPDPDAPGRSFVYWQKWTWETEDIPVGLLIAGTMDGRTLSPGEIAAYDAPFPDPSYKMGPRAMPSQVPTLPDDPSLPANLRAWEVLSKWEKPFLCAFTDNDPVTRGLERSFHERIPGTQGQPHTTIRGGGHFLQEGRAEQFAQIVAGFVKSGA
ncbi:MAG: alpha/beta fold hydrolase [Deltaproteobacteria bacterium]|nr:MAG: alpha/beta fold hydrolase [Deltaproteobacteria bacterium]